MPHRKLFATALFAFALLNGRTASSQAMLGEITRPPEGGNWARVEALPIRTRLHITTDHGSHTCRVFAVTNDALTCEAGSGTAGRVVQREDVQHIKLAHHGRSALVGAGIGAGAGAIGGAVSARCSSPQNFCIVGPGAVAAVLGVGGAVLGSVVGAATDIARGSSIYVRP